MMQKRGAAVRIFHIELILACVTANLLQKPKLLLSQINGDSG